MARAADSLDKFPSSTAFDVINESLQASEAERKDAIKQANAVFGFTLKNAEGETESWHIDLKEKGEVKKGLPAKPTGELNFQFRSRPRPSWQLVLNGPRTFQSQRQLGFFGSMGHSRG
jgi:hypothetical protein